MPAISFQLFHSESLLYLVPQGIINDGRYAALDTNIAVYVDAAVLLIGTQPVKTVFVPSAFICGFDAPAVQIAGNIREQLAGSDTGIDLPDDGCCWFIHHDLAIFAPLVAQRLPAVGHALVGIVHQAAAHILGKVVRIELVDIHHAAQRKPPGG